MEVNFSSYDDIPGISKFDLQYLKEDPIFTKYHSFNSDIDGIRAAVKQKKENYKFRQELKQVLLKQHKNIVNQATQDSIELLSKENSFCVTSAHQPCLFGGPAYFIYKIASTINLAKRLSIEFPENNFVPVFYLGSEDHDFDEINHLFLFNTKMIWENSGSGACGRLNTNGLEKVKMEILAFYENQIEIRDSLNTLLETALQEENYKLCIRSIIYQLFANYGLIVIDPDDSELKRLAIPIFQDEISNKTSSKLLLSTIEKMEADKLKVQAKGRDINLFYLVDNLRERIIPKGDNFEVQNTNLKFSKDSILQELNSFPDRFSPNVILRPLYQETILPSVAFVGGGGEVAYWTELRDIFNYFKVTFPPIFRRNSVSIIDTFTQKKISKTGLSFEDFLHPIDKVEHIYLEKNSELLDFSNFKDVVNKEWEVVIEKAKLYDNSLIGRINADRTIFLEKIEDLEKRLNKQIKVKNETGLNQINTIYQKIYPNNTLQERYESSIYILANFGENIINYLVENLNPLDKRFIIITPQV